MRTIPEQPTEEISKRLQTISIKDIVCIRRLSPGMADAEALRVTAMESIPPFAGL
jgi:hypothetical protein